MNIPGTLGYADVTQQFIEATIAIDFEELHKDFLPFIPQKSSRILDVGAGIGRDAFIFSKMGHTVVAVEPTTEFLNAGKKLYKSPNIEWIEDSLPILQSLTNQINQFDFILASGIWHHLDNTEQYKALQKIEELLSPKGIFALTLRNGPAGAGTCVFPTSGEETIKNAEAFGLKTMLFIEKQPSLMKNKENVFWTRLVFQKML